MTARRALADGLPAGCIEYAASLLGGVSPDTALEHLLLPAIVSDAWTPPDPPLRVGDGAVQADLGPDDREPFARLLEVVGPDPTARQVADRAQEWRLPVVDYVRRGNSADRPSAAILHAMACKNAAVGLEAAVVVDLSTLWAGPLCTRLLAEAGAEVIKVDSEVRPDGFRADPPLYKALNEGKCEARIDVRTEAGRDELLGLVSRADAVVDSFSPRVMPNLRLTRDDLDSVRPGLITLSIPAFGPGPRRNWVAYGSGVHAALGLGEVDGDFVAPPISYPDPLAGMAAFAVLSRALAERRPGHIEVSLEAATAPLLAA